MPEDNMIPDNLDAAASDAFDAAGAPEVPSDAGSAFDQLTAALAGDDAPTQAASPFSTPNEQVQPFDTAAAPQAASAQDPFAGGATQQMPVEAAYQQPYDSTQVMPQDGYAQPGAAPQPGYDPAQGASQGYYDPNQPQYAQPVYDPNQAQYVQSGSNPGTTPMVLGILSIVFAGIIGLILSILAIKQSGEVTRTYGENSRAKAGKITGIIGLVLSILGAILTIFLVVGTFAVVGSDEFQEAVEQELNNSAPAISIDEFDDETADSDSAVGYVGTSEDEEAAIAAVSAELDTLKNPSELERSIIASEFEESFGDEAGELSQWGLEADEFVDWLIGDFSYTPKSCTIYSEDEGFVEVSVTSRDLYSFESAYSDAVTEYIESADVNAITNEEDFYKEMGKLLKDVMGQTQTSEKTVLIDVIKENGTWKCDESSLEWAISDIYGV